MTESWEPVVPLAPDYAGDTRVVGRRVLQFVLDVLAVQVVVVVVSAALGFVLRVFLSGALDLLLTGLMWLWLSLLGWLLVTIVWPSVDGGRTPGMRWCGLRVVMSTTGARPGAGAHALRCGLTLIDGFAFGLVGLVVMSNSARQQRLGDLVAGTLVVRDR